MHEFDFNSLIRFIEQSNQGGLTKSSYPDKYHDFKVKIGFGQGTPARVPWIAFLKFNQKVTKGIYPVYLYYKSKNLLILAYGVSATEEPARDWDFNESSPETVQEYFHNNGLGTVARYQNSYVYETYQVDHNKENFGLDEVQAIQDLNNLLSFFEKQFENLDSGSSDNEKIDTNEEIEKDVDNSIVSMFLEDAQDAGLFIQNDFVIRFIASLLTKPFVILTGLSGSGKTKLAQAFARWICQDDREYRIIPVAADWTNREPLLGYPNSLESTKYVKPDNGLLDLILCAIDKPDKPFFLILDEMNLSHVERYFADFLSALESGEPIHLHSSKDELDGVPQKIVIPANLFIIGTVNVDETTYMFSPKVLDRANVIEFRITQEEMNTYLLSSSMLDLNRVDAKGSKFAKLLIQEINFLDDNVSTIHQTLLSFFVELKQIGAEFGYRSAGEIYKFYSVVKFLFPWKNDEWIIDVSIIQKLLPKVHGSRRKLENVLRTIASQCIRNPDTIDDLLTGKLSSETINHDIKYPISLEKILRMYQGMIQNGFTSYAEA